MKTKYEYKDKSQLIDDINSLINYQGYVQFSHRPIDLKTDVFKDKKVFIENDAKDGFIYEAHFCNEKESIAIKQINDSWLVSKTPLSNIDKKDIQIYESIDGTIRMAQVWKHERDILCDDGNNERGREVKKLKKVVFAGFVGDKR